MLVCDREETGVEKIGHSSLVFSFLVFLTKIAVVWHTIKPRTPHLFLREHDYNRQLEVTILASTTTIVPEKDAAAYCPIARVLALPEIWSNFAEQGGWSFVESWRLTSGCRGSRVGL